MASYCVKTIKVKYSLDDAYERAIAILEFLNWSYRSNGSYLLVAQTSFNIYGTEQLTISFDDKHHMKVVSESRNPFQLFDMGKNQNNVEKFIEIFRRATFPLEESEFASEKHRSFLDRFLSAK